MSSSNRSQEISSIINRLSGYPQQNKQRIQQDVLGLLEQINSLAFRVGTLGMCKLKVPGIALHMREPIIPWQSSGIIASADLFPLCSAQRW